MAGIRLDGAGQAKMTTLDDSLLLQQRIHGLVETYALSVKQNKPAGSIMQNLKRQMPLLAAKLKGQFGMISDLVTSINMQMTRGSSEQMRVRTMREGMAAIKQQLEIAIAQTIAKHKVEGEAEG
jgi:hypoxanthine-guanine phosphoribosyltransferase